MLSFLLIIFVAVFNGVILAEDDDAQIEKFYIVSRDDPAMGGCTNDEILQVKTAYTEAMKMVRGAMSDIDTFNAPKRCIFSFLFRSSYVHQGCQKGFCDTTFRQLAFSMC